MTNTPAVPNGVTFHRLHWSPGHVVRFWDTEYGTVIRSYEAGSRPVWRAYRTLDCAGAVGFHVHNGDTWTFPTRAAATVALLEACRSTLTVPAEYVAQS